MEQGPEKLIHIDFKKKKKIGIQGPSKEQEKSAPTYDYLGPQAADFRRLIEKTIIMKKHLSEMPENKATLTAFQQEVSRLPLKEIFDRINNSNLSDWMDDPMYFTALGERVTAEKGEEIFKHLMDSKSPNDDDLPS